MFLCITQISITEFYNYASTEARDINVTKYFGTLSLNKKIDMYWSSEYVIISRLFVSVPVGAVGGYSLARRGVAWLYVALSCTHYSLQLTRSIMRIVCQNSQISGSYYLIFYDFEAVRRQ